MNLSPIGKLLIVTGAAIILLGVAVLFFDKVPLFGKLPGDIIIKKRNFSIYFPLGMSILLSLILTAILYIINLLKK